MKPVVVAVALAAALGLGWLGGRMTAPEAAPTAAPGDWIARIGNQYVTEAMFIEEMQRRGGNQPGQFQSVDQRRALLDDLVYRRALVDAAQRAGLDAQPAVRRSLDQILANQYLQGTLRQKQQDIAIAPADVRSEYERRTDSYTVPARRRLAMLRIGVAAGADDSTWSQAEERMAQARTRALALGADVPHFGVLAREYSDDRASRYRGGVIGWITEDRAERYTWDAAALDAGLALEHNGDVSEVLRGTDGVYLVRLVEAEPARARDFDDLADGIRQGLLQQRLTQAEHDFRVDLVKNADVEVRDAALAAIAPIGPAADTAAPQPPAMPTQEG